jgi:hypothetical protein
MAKHISELAQAIQGAPMSDVRLYAGLGGETTWNRAPVAPGSHACIAPVYGRKKRTMNRVGGFAPDVKIIQDSGAFSDNWNERLTFSEALKRQENHAHRYGYWEQITHRATYDLLIDEVWDNGNRFKRRWSVLDAESAVDTTVAAAQFLNEHRDFHYSLVVSAQGVDAPQYLRCAKRLMPFMQAGDYFGFGGWCIIGKMPAVMMPVFRETVALVVPFLGKEGIKHIHIWGVIYPKALGVLLWECQQWGIKVSTDSVGPTTHPIFGQWGYGEWRDNTYMKPAIDQLGFERARHTQLTRAWLDRFKTTPHYHPYSLPRKQGVLF